MLDYTRYCSSSKWACTCLRRYGSTSSPSTLFTMRDDKYFGLNDVLSKPYDNCYRHHEPLRPAYYSCLSSEQKVLFNIVYSMIKSPQKQTVGYNTTRHSAGDFFE